MINSVSDEELLLKKRARRRLVGAIVLVIVVIAILPMILDAEPETLNQEISIQIPNPNGGTIVESLQLKPTERKADLSRLSAVSPVDIEAQDDKSKDKTDKAGSESASEVIAETKVAPKIESTPVVIESAELAKADGAPKAAVKSDTKDKEKEKSKPTGYVVQVAALGDAAKAKLINSKIINTGMKSYTETVNVEKGTITRVRVGPYASREAADKAIQQLKRLQLEGKVVPLHR